MAFVDELKLNMKAGAGGNGVVRWRHEKGKEFSGASGGNGGKGGDIYARAVRDIGILGSYRNVKKFEAERGVDGMKKSMFGRNGKDLMINFPIGSIITNLETKQKFELLKEGEEALLLKGGQGGYGNEHFKASTNVTPYQSTTGKPGQMGTFSVELLLIADAGLIGLPNAGKTSLLNVLTNATAKVGSYQFTTLEPNLGDMFGFILADIPGLIEGAGEGKGLGHKFLRHIKRTRVLLHCISLENEDLKKAYEVIRTELQSYSKELVEKKEVIILTKTDVISPAKVIQAVKKMKKINPDVLTVSVYDDVSIKALSDSLIKLFRTL